MQSVGGFDLSPYGADAISVKYYKAQAKLEVSIALERYLGAGELGEIRRALAALMPECTLELDIIPPETALLEDMEEFAAVAADSIAYFNPAAGALTAGAVFEAGEDGRIALRVPEKFAGAVEKSGCAEKLRNFLAENYEVRTEIDVVGDSNLKPSPVKRSEAPVAAARKVPRAAARAAGLKVAPADVIFGAPKATKPVPMSEVNEESGTVTVSGARISIDVKKRKNGGFIVNMCLTDRTNTLAVKLFLKETEKKTVERLEAVDSGENWITVHGRFDRDEFTGQYCLFADSGYQLPAKLRLDRAGEKRVELHLHTKMSALDGFIDAKTAVKTAAKWGHRAVAITDHGVVQAFPDAVSAAAGLKKAGKDIKVVLGVEGYLLPDCECIPMEGSAFACIALTVAQGEAGGIFALEAVKDGERFYTLVNPGMVPDGAILRATGAGAEDFALAPSEREAVTALVAFIKGAHPAFMRREDAALLCDMLPRGKKAALGAVADVSLIEHYLENKLPQIGAKDGEPAPSFSAEEVRARLEAALERMRAKGITKFPLVRPREEAKVKGKRTNFHIILLAKNIAGLRNLYELVSYSHLEYLAGVPRIPKSLLLFHREGMIAGSACEAGELFRAVLENRPEEEIRSIAEEYDYLEVQPIGNNRFLVRADTVADDEGLRELNRRIVRLGEELGKPVVATGDVHFMEPDDAVYRAIVMSARDFKDAEQQAPLYFRTTEDMLEEFSYLGEEKAREVVITNPNAIADSCDSLQPYLSEKRTYAPRFENDGEILREMTEKRAREIYGDPLPQVVSARLERELTSIIGNDYASLYLSAQRLVSKSMSDGYLVGSRGSVGSSFVATMAGITEVNPLQPHYVCPKCRHSDFDVDLGKYSCGVDMPDARCPVCGTEYQKLGYTIPFEVFLGFKGDKTPDIDLNFSGEYQPVAHQYTEEMFGKGHAFRAGTISGLKDKTVYGYLKGYCEQYNKLFTRPETDRLVAGCTGVKRTTGQHPGGIVIVPEGYSILDFTPVQYPADKKEKDTITTHFDFHAMDDRLVKLDILGHDDPTALRMLNDLTGLDPRTIPLDDGETMKLFSSIEPLGITLEELDCEVGSIAIPEFGTSFVRKMLMDTRPTTMEELVRIAGLSHGTDVWLGNAEPLVLGKVATLSEVICTRDDIMNYLIARGGDPSLSFKTMESVRKGKGITEEMEKAMKAIDTPAWFIDSCRKIGYMFPRAHAAAYVMMAFRIAYYKVHYPLEFYAVYYTVRADAFDAAETRGGEMAVLRNIKRMRRESAKLTDKDENLFVILEVVYEMNRRGIELLPVDMEKSDPTKFLVEDGAIRPPLSSVAGVGRNAALAIGEAREAAPFSTVDDLRTRGKANSAVIEALRALGCLEGLSESGQTSLFD